MKGKRRYYRPKPKRGKYDTLIKMVIYMSQLRQFYKYR